MDEKPFTPDHPFDRKPGMLWTAWNGWSKAGLRRTQVEVCALILTKNGVITTTAQQLKHTGKITSNF